MRWELLDDFRWSSVCEEKFCDERYGCGAITIAQLHKRRLFGGVRVSCPSQPPPHSSHKPQAPAMSLPSTWRQFQLFDFLPIRDPNYNSTEPLFSDPLLAAIANTQTYIAFATHTYVKLLTKDKLTLEGLFCGYEAGYRITFMKALAHSNLLVTLAEKQGSPAVIKVWDLNKILLLEKVPNLDENTIHKYVTKVLVHDGNDAYPISCFTFNDYLTCIAVGYTNGRVLLVRGDLLRDRGSKQRLVYESVDPITGIHFNKVEDVLYVTTTSKIITVLTTGRNDGKPLRVLSNSLGASLGCSDLESRLSMLIVANTEGFQYYNHVSRAQVINFSLEKKQILRLFKDYLLVICPIEETSSSTKKTLTRIIILDLKNMHISFNLTVPNLMVSHAFISSADNNVFLLSTDGVLYKLHEKPVNQQVEIVLQRNLFSIALALAEQYKLDYYTHFRINKLNADYLYENLDYDGSILKYIDSLQLVQSANAASAGEFVDVDDFVINVIKRFKEVSNIHNMTRFLSKLYQLKLADSDHLTLLLCCYCKLKMTEELDSFIDSLNVDNSSSDSLANDPTANLNFPLIINLFKECGYFNQVIKLLYKLNHPHMIVEVQLNELNQFSSCMSYMKSLSIDELLRILIDFLKDLLDNMPLETTELLINVFTGKYKPEASHKLFDDVPAVSPFQNVEKETIHNTVSSYTAFLRYLGGGSGENAVEETEESKNIEPTYLPPRPSLVFSCFINHPREFVVFLEACMETFDKYQGNVADKKDLLITLFEMYLSMSREELDQKDEWLGKAKTLMDENSTMIDKSRVLLISHIYDFKEGEVFAKKSSDDFEEGLLRMAQASGDLNAVLDVVKKYGEEKPVLYKMVFKFIFSSNEIFKQATPAEFRFFLEKLKQHKIASTLDIINIVSSNENATIGLVKDFLIEYIGQANKEISNNNRLIQSYESESTKNSFKLTELTSKPVIFQNNKCSNCELKLDFPLIHFKCKHSYHQRCLNENIYIPSEDADDKPKCPLCIHELQASRAVRNNQFKSKENYETFEMSLNNSADRFKVVSEYLGKGVMETEIPPE